MLASRLLFFPLFANVIRFAASRHSRDSPTRIERPNPISAEQENGGDDVTAFKMNGSE
jgi:hypothetical protein